MSEAEAVESAMDEIDDLKRRIRELETSCEGWRVAYEHERQQAAEAYRSVAIVSSRLARAVSLYRKKHPTGRLPYYLQPIDSRPPGQTPVAGREGR